MSTDSTDPVARVRAWFAEHDPEVLAAVDDVDRTLIWSSFAQTPFERLDRAVHAARTWAHPWTDLGPYDSSAR